MFRKKVFFLSIQSSYHAVELAFYKDELQFEMRSIKKIDASATLIPVFDEVLQAHNLHVTDLSFIAVNQGPAPFTTLRVVIVSVNGISFAGNIPLIGIDGLEALLKEQYDSHLLPTVALLDAFANDVYYAIQPDDTKIIKGCKPIRVLLQELNGLFPTKKIRFIGNGTSLHKDAIREVFENRALIDEPVISLCSIEQIARMGLKQWYIGKDISYYIVPLYLKKQWWQA